MGLQTEHIKDITRESRLQSLWNVMSGKEKDYLKYRDPIQGRQRLRLEYVNARNLFDKHLRQCEHAYKRGQALDIEKCSRNGDKTSGTFVIVMKTRTLTIINMNSQSYIKCYWRTI